MPSEVAVGTRAVPRYRPSAGDTARDQHAKFLEEYGLSKENVPLMLFDPRNWETPFRVRKDIYENPA